MLLASLLRQVPVVNASPSVLGVFDSVVRSSLAVSVVFSAGAGTFFHCQLSVKSVRVRIRLQSVGLTDSLIFLTSQNSGSMSVGHYV